MALELEALHRPFQQKQGAVVVGRVDRSRGPSHATDEDVVGGPPGVLSQRPCHTTTVAGARAPVLAASCRIRANVRTCRCARLTWGVPCRRDIKGQTPSVPLY